MIEISVTIKANDLFDARDAFEKQVIREALVRHDGAIMPSADDLGVSHQTLIGAINSRHRDLISARSPIRKRRQSIIIKKKPRKSK